MIITYTKAVPHAARGLIMDAWKDNILAQFPTSTYAAYAVYDKWRNMIPGTNSPETAAVGDAARTYAERLITPNRDPSVPNYRVPAAQIQLRIQQLEQVLTCHPEFPLRAGLYLTLGIQHLEGEQFPAAVIAFKKCLEQQPSQEVADTARVYLDVLQKYGWK